MVRFMLRLVARLVELAAWFAVGYLVGLAIDAWREHELERLRSMARRPIGLDPRPRATGLDLSEAWAAADELAARRRGLDDAEA